MGNANDIDYADLHDPNAEYTMRELSAEAMGATAKRGGGRDVEITDVQTTMIDGNFPWTLVRIYTDAGIVGVDTDERPREVPVDHRRLDVRDLDVTTAAPLGRGPHRLG